MANQFICASALVALLDRLTQPVDWNEWQRHWHALTPRAPEQPSYNRYVDSMMVKLGPLWRDDLTNNKRRLWNDALQAPWVCQLPALPTWNQWQRLVGTRLRQGDASPALLHRDAYTALVKQLCTCSSSRSTGCRIHEHTRKSVDLELVPTLVGRPLHYATNQRRLSGLHAPQLRTNLATDTGPDATRLASTMTLKFYTACLGLGPHACARPTRRLLQPRPGFKPMPPLFCTLRPKMWHALRNPWRPTQR
ncbi:unnamed protein product [Symbiodinium sp. CCMP2592]|nr:unnamed protein product [Symbiodinium sp. CCMP2592]